MNSSGPQSDREGSSSSDHTPASSIRADNFRMNTRDSQEFKKQNEHPFPPKAIPVGERNLKGAANPDHENYGWRNTVEYRAAWDLEVWKAVQAERFRKQLETHKSAALVDLSKRIQRKEKEELSSIQRRIREVDAREERLRQEEIRQQQQKRRLEDGERELMRARQQLIETQKRVEEEIRVQVRRANQDFEHKTALLREQVKVSESHSRHLEERLRQSEADYLQLFEEFHRFRTDHVTGTSNGVVSSLLETSGGLSLETIRSRHSEELRLLQERLEQKAQHQLIDVQRRCSDLENQNRRLTAALVRRREQLRSRNGGNAATQPAAKTVVRSSTGSCVCPTASFSSEKCLLVTELDRLQKEKCRLVEESCGALRSGDPVLEGLDNRIAFLQVQLKEESSTKNETGLETA